MIDFKTSKTKENLLKAFAGESQARNRYTFAAEVAKTEGYPILHDLFIYTANQEKAHAQQFMEKLKEYIAIKMGKICNDIVWFVRGEYVIKYIFIIGFICLIFIVIFSLLKVASDFDDEIENSYNNFYEYGYLDEKYDYYDNKYKKIIDNHDEIQ